jgi:hypothetical protein
MRNAGIQPTQLLQQPLHPPPQPAQQAAAGHQLSQHPGLSGHIYSNHIGVGAGPGRGGGDQIRDVWASNLEQEFDQVRNLIPQYPFVSMVGAFLLGEFMKCRIQSFPVSLLDLLDSLKLRTNIIIRRYGVMSIYSR